MRKEETYFVVSYMPLLQFTDENERFLELPNQNADPANAEAVAAKLTNKLDQVPNVEVRACVWMYDHLDSKFYPVFLIDNAHEVADHLVKWAENDPAAWFSLFAEKIDEERYVIMLFPNLDQSIKRFKLACLQYLEIIPSTNAKYTMIFRPLEFISQHNTTFERVVLSDEMMIGFLDTTDFNKEAGTLNMEKIKYIGPIKRTSREEEVKTPKGSFILEYVKNMLDEES